MMEKDKKDYTFKPNIEKEEIDLNSPPEPAPGIPELIAKQKAQNAEREKAYKSQIKSGDDPQMRFSLTLGKFNGTFKQFGAQQKGPGKKQEKPEKPKSKKKQAQPPFSTEISPQKDDDRAANMPMQVNKKSEEPPAKAQETREALLYIDVNLANIQKRIIVYKGDTAPGLAEQFAHENSN